MREVQAHEAVVRLQERVVDGEVGGRPRVRLHIDAPLRRVQVERLQRPLLRTWQQWQLPQAVSQL